MVPENGKRVEHGDRTAKSPQVVTLVPYSQQLLLGIMKLMEAALPGFDRFPPPLIEQCLGRYAEHDLGIDLHNLLALGRQNPSDPSASFNMAYLAILTL